MKKLTCILMFFASAACAQSQADETPPLPTAPAAGDVIEPKAEVTPVSVLKDLTIVYRELSDNSGVANVICSADETLVGGGCACTGEPAANQGGFLFACATNGSNDGYVGACYDLDVGQTATPVLVSLQCAKTSSVDVAQAAPGVDSEDPVLGRYRAMADAYRASLR